MVHMSRVIGVRVRSRLPVVVQDGPRALGVDCRDLRHHLAIIVVRVVIVLARSGLLLRRTDLLRARSLGAVAVVPVLALVRFVRRVSALRCLIALVTVLLLIMHSTPPEHVGKSSDTVPVAGVEPVPPELSQFPVSHLLGLFNLLRIELNLRGINCIRATPCPSASALSGGSRSLSLLSFWAGSAAVLLPAYRFYWAILLLSWLMAPFSSFLRICSSSRNQASLV